MTTGMAAVWGLGCVRQVQERELGRMRAEEKEERRIMATEAMVKQAEMERSQYIDEVGRE